MKDHNVVENYYAIPSDLIHDGNKEDILKLYGSLISSDKTEKINVYSSEVDWKAWPTNIALLLMVGVAGFLLSSANPYIALFTIVITAPLFHWRKVKGVISFLEVAETINKSRNKKLSPVGRLALIEYAKKTGQLKQ
jgi:hypothetical protein